MKLIDILVKELPKRGGWPKGVEEICQDYDRELKYFGDNRPSYRSGIYTDNLCSGHREKHSKFYGEKVSREQYEYAITASKQQAWSGQGLPPVGCDCEWKDDRTNQWVEVKVVYASEWMVVIEDKEGTELAVEFYGGCRGKDFRTIRTESDRKRDEAIAAMRKNVSNHNKTDVINAIVQIYDAIVGGEIPGIKID